MAAQLKGKKAATRQARKILLRQIDKASAPLKAKQAADSKVHRARKQIKMARATLRLLRKRLPRKRYRAENKRLRDAAKPLSAARDATALLATFEQLLEGKRRDHRSGIKDFHNELTRERVRTRRKLAGHDGLARSRRLLHRARAHARHWHVGSKGWSVVGAGLPAESQSLGASSSGGVVVASPARAGFGIGSQRSDTRPNPGKHVQSRPDASMYA